MTEAEQGSHSELGHSAKRKKPDSRDGRYTHRPAVSPPADDICQLVDSVMVSFAFSRIGLTILFFILGLPFWGSSLELTT